MTTETTTLCSVTGCSRAVEGAPWSTMCSKHAMRQYRTGTTGANPMKRADLAIHRKRISFVLDKYGRSKAVAAAVMLADDLLNWRPKHDWTVQYTLAEQMQRLRDGGVTAREVLQRVCEVWALQAFEQRFDGERVLEYGLARAVLMLRGQRTWRPAGPLLRLLGRELREAFGKFAAGVCWRIEEDDKVRAGAKQAFDQWAMRGE